MRTSLIRVDRNEFLIPQHPRVLQALERLGASFATNFGRYERPEARDEFIAHLKQRLGLNPETPGVLGHGAEDLLARLFLWARLHKPVAYASLITWESYQRLAASAAFQWRAIETSRNDDGTFATNLDALRRELATADGDALVLLTSPNNPTGHAVAPEAVAELCERFPRNTFVIDAVYDDFPSPHIARLSRLSNAIVLGSFSKYFALPGLRIGFAVGAGLPDGLSWELGFPPGWFDIAHAALAELPHYARARDQMLQFASRQSAISRSRFRVIASAAPFLFAEVRGKELTEAERLRREDVSGLIPKYITREPWGNFVRFALGSPDVNSRVEVYLRDL